MVSLLPLFPLAFQLRCCKPFLFWGFNPSPMNRRDWLHRYSYRLDQAEALSGAQFPFLSNEGVGLHSVALNPDCSGKPPGKMKSPRKDPPQPRLRMTALRDSVIDCQRVTAWCPQPRGGRQRSCPFWAPGPELQGCSFCACLPPPPQRSKAVLPSPAMHTSGATC